MNNNKVISVTKAWLNEFVIELNLCPFAKQALGSTTFVVSEAQNKEGLLVDLEHALLKMKTDTSIETLLLIHPMMLQDFQSYNQFLEIVDDLLRLMSLEGVFQVASFHPKYRFSETEIESADNYTNRSPFPMLHILRESSVEQAVIKHPNIDAIAKHNIQQMRSIGLDTLRLKLSMLQTAAE